MESAVVRGIGPIKIASLADLKRLVNVPRLGMIVVLRLNVLVEVKWVT